MVWVVDDRHIDDVVVIGKNEIKKTNKVLLVVAFNRIFSINSFYTCMVRIISRPFTIEMPLNPPVVLDFQVPDVD